MDLLPMNELPPEILSHIFSQLPSIDLLNIAKVCHHFRDLCNSQHVVGSLNFSKAYNLKYEFLSEFLRPKMRYMNVVEIDLRHCYWFPQRHLHFLGKLKNLKSLELLDTKVTMNNLVRIVGSLPQIQRLSLTWEGDTNRSKLNKGHYEVLKDSLTQLQTLTVQVTNPFQLAQVCCLLNCCKQLQYFTISESSVSWDGNSDLLAPAADPFVLMLPQLRKAKFFFRVSMGFGLESFMYEVLKATAPYAHLQEIWTCQGSCSVLRKLCLEKNLTIPILQKMTVLSLDGYHTDASLTIRGEGSAYTSLMRDILQQGEGLRHCRQLSLDCQKLNGEELEAVANKCRALQILSIKHCIPEDPLEVFSKIKMIVRVCQNLSSLSLLGTHYHSFGNPCLNLVDAKNLEKLALPVCYLASYEGEPTVNSSQSDSFDRFSSIRLGCLREGVKTQFTDDEIQSSNLFCLTVNCTKLKTLIIKTETIAPVCQSLCNLVFDKSLLCISNWKDLQTLVLHGLPAISSGIFLIEVCKNISKLQHLVLGDIGPKTCFKYNHMLVRALPLCHNLKDFRLEQRYDVVLHSLENALVQCPNLERFSLISEQGPTSFELHELIHFVHLMPKLIGLFLVLPAPLKHCSKVLKGLMKEFAASRPAFSCSISRSHGDFIIDGEWLPSCHRDEMLRLPIL